MKYNILGWVSFSLLVVSFVLFLKSGGDGGKLAISFWTLLSSALFGSISLYINDRKIENRKKSRRFVSMIAVVITFLFTLFLLFAGLSGLAIM